MIAIALGLLVAFSSVSALPRPGPMPRAAPQPRAAPGPVAGPDPYLVDGYGGCGCGCGVPCYGGYGVTEAFGYAEPPVLVGEQVLIPEVGCGAYPYGGRVGGYRGVYPGLGFGPVY